MKRLLPTGTSLLYEKGCGVGKDSVEEISKAMNIVRRADVAVMVLGEEADLSGEAASRSDLNLPRRQKNSCAPLVRPESR